MSDRPDGDQRGEEDGTPVEVMGGDAVPDAWFVAFTKSVLTSAVVGAWVAAYIGVAFGYAVEPPQFAVVTLFLFALIGYFWGLTPGDLLKVLRS